MSLDVLQKELNDIGLYLIQDAKSPEKTWVTDKNDFMFVSYSKLITDITFKSSKDIAKELEIYFKMKLVIKDFKEKDKKTISSTFEYYYNEKY